MKDLVLALLIFSNASFAQDDKLPQQPDWVRFTEPGDAHKNLDNIVGEFNYKMRAWSDPLAKVEEFSGTTNNKWILNGRYVQQDFKGKFMNRNFDGLGITGYDNFRNEYQSVWLDSMSTAMWWSSGQNMPATKVIREEGVGADPAKKQRNRWFRSELKIDNKNKHTFTMYGKSVSGKEYKTMEIAYTRKGYTPEENPQKYLNKY